MDLGVTQAFKRGPIIAMMVTLAVACTTTQERGTVDSGSADVSIDASGPYLTSLEISGSVMTPQFSPDVHDYYVMCAAGSNALTVVVAASAHADSAVIQPTRSASLPQQTLSINVSEGDAIVAVATLGTLTSPEYWVRCLPHDFPAMHMVQYPDAGTPTPGYYLVGHISAPVDMAAYAMAVDGNGVPVWYASAGSNAYDVDTIVNGVISFNGGTTDRSFAFDYVSPLKTTYLGLVGGQIGDHELQPLSNGHFVTLTSSTTTGVDLTGLAIPLPNGTVQTFGPNSSFVDNHVYEVDAEGNPVWEWTASEHFDVVKDMTYLSPPLSEPGIGDVVDAFHCNSIDVDESGNLLVSCRAMDSIFYIERATGKVLWKMGGSTYSKDNATYVPVVDPFHREHDARLQASWKSTCSGRSGSGQISVFDDETALPGPARGVVYDVNIGASGCGDDGGAPGATVAWQYKGTTAIDATGSFRLSPDGAIIGWGTNANFVFTETDAKGNPLRDFYFDGTSSYRAIKVPLTAFDLEALRHAAGRANNPDAGQ